MQNKFLITGQSQVKFDTIVNSNSMLKTLQCVLWCLLPFLHHVTSTKNSFLRLIILCCTTRVSGSPFPRPLRHNTYIKSHSPSRYGPLWNHDGSHFGFDTNHMLGFHCPSLRYAHPNEALVTSFSRPTILSPRNGLYCHHQVEINYGRAQ